MAVGCKVIEKIESMSATGPKHSEAPPPTESRGTVDVLQAVTEAHTHTAKSEHTAHRELESTGKDPIR